MLIPSSLIPAFTLVHVAISLVAIASGFVVVYGMISHKPLDRWNVLFLATTVATSVTGFGFPIKGMTPGLAIGAVSLVILAVAVYARYPKNLDGHWRWVYAVTALSALYLNFLVLIVQSFQKIPFLHALAPHQNEAPFVATQVVALVAFCVVGALSTKRFGRQAAV